jgi:mRNA deadenylase 3'-5' endonuclease subunit Ccr4
MLRWRNRCKRVLEELKLTGADILLVQEVDHFYDFYKKEFALLGYQSIFDIDKTKQHGN